MPSCTICRVVREWFYTDPTGKAAREWQNLDDWEHSSEWYWEPETSEAEFQRIEESIAVRETDPEAELAILHELADQGSSWAMRTIAHSYEVGRVTAKDDDLAEDWYWRAIGAGSWSATISYAGMLAKRDEYPACFAVLQDGIDAGWAPAYFWLAWYRFKRSRSRETARDLKPLLEQAISHGNPMAKLFLPGLMILGKFGIWQIPRGFKLFELSLDNADTFAASKTANLPEPKHGE